MTLALAQLSSDRLAELVARFGRARVAVLGDFFLDKYLEVNPALAEPSLETGKVAHQVVAIRTSPGAAGTVTGNLAALGAGTLHAIGFTGDDGEGYELRRGLRALGCSTDHLHLAAARYTPTYLKPRDGADRSLAGEHSRYDTKNRQPTPPDLVAAILASLDALLPAVDAVAVMDQVDEADTGVVTAAVRAALAEHARRFPRMVFWADSRRRIRQFRGLILKPNQFEALGAAAPAEGAAVSLDELAQAGQCLCADVGAPVVVTRGAHGLLVCGAQTVRVSGVRVDGPVDPTGAGDSVSAGAVLALAVGATLPEAALIGNLVASITVQQLGTTGTARPEELPPRLALWQAQARAAAHG